LGGDALLVNADNRLRKLQMVRINDIRAHQSAGRLYRAALHQLYLVEGERTFKLGSERLLWALQWLHKATPPDFNFQLVRDPKEWFDAVSLKLLAELSRRDPELRARLRAAVAA